MNNLNETQLEILYVNFVNYRDKVCDGAAKMSVHEFFRKFGLSPWKQ